MAPLNAGEKMTMVNRPLHVGTFTQVSAGSAHTCAIRSDGTLELLGK